MTALTARSASPLVWGRAGVVAPAKLAASLQQFTRAVGVDVIDLVVGGEELSEDGLCVLGVLVLSREGHDYARVFVEYDKGVFITMPVRSVVGSQDDVVGGEGFGEALGDEGLVLGVFVGRCRWWVRFVSASAGCVLDHGPCTDLTVWMLGSVTDVV